MRTCPAPLRRPPRAPWFGLAALLLLTVVVTSRGAETPHPLSTRRLTQIRTLLRQEAARQSPDRGAPFLAAVETAFTRTDGCPLRPTGTPLSARQIAATAAAAAEAEALRRFPPLDEAALRAEAERAYPLLADGTVLTVTYQINPARQSTAAGPYRGRAGDMLVIGARKIRLADIVPAAERDQLNVRTDARLAQARRDEHVAARLAAREQERAQFVAAVLPRHQDSAAAAAIRTAEAAGFIWYGADWVSASAAVRALAEQEREDLLALWAGSQAAAEPDTKPVVAALPLVPPPATAPGTPDTPALPVPPASPAPAVPATAPVPTVAAPPPDTPAAPAAATPPEPPAMPPVAAPEVNAWLPALFFVITGLAVLVAGGWLVALLIPEKASGSRFYDNRAAAESDFWAGADQAEGRCAYVAYRFPDYAAAFRAMGQLSFVEQTAPNRPLWATAPIQLGIYMHDHLFVAFVGGAQLTHAMWREAVLVLGRAEGSEKHRISDAPAPAVTLPDLDAHPTLRQGVQQVRHTLGERDDYAEYLVYEGRDKAAALAFLKLVRVGAAGVHVVVQTPEGHWGRDSQGMYKE